MITATLKFKRN